MNVSVIPKSPLIRPEGLRTHVEKFLREAIMEGQFLPGERLIERELCEMLGVSRSSLREALRQLEAEKLITMRLHRGPTVAIMSREEAIELYAVRAMLESYAVHEFTGLASDTMVARLGQAVQALHLQAKMADRKALLAAKAAFYDIILSGCGNRIVKEMLLGMLTRINQLRSTSFSQTDRLRQSLQEIDGLFSLIQQRDAKAAQEAARQHIVNAQQAALAVLQEQLAVTSTQPIEENHG